MLQGHRPLLSLDDMTGLALEPDDPLGEFVSVGDSGAEHDDVGLLRQQDERLLPDHAAFLVAHLVDLVEHDVFGFVDDTRAAEEHVALDLRGHDEAERVGVDGDVAGHEPDLLFAEDEPELAQFLVRQRLDRRGLNHSLVVLQRERNAVYGDCGFPCRGMS